MFEGMLNIMNIGFMACIILVPIFVLMGLVFGIMKDKSASLMAYAVWMYSFFKEVRFDVHKAFDRYRIN